MLSFNWVGAKPIAWINYWDEIEENQEIEEIDEIDETEENEESDQNQINNEFSKLEYLFENLILQMDNDKKKCYELQR